MARNLQAASLLFGLSASASLLIAQLVLPPALSPIEAVWAAEPRAGDIGSVALIEALQEELGDRLRTVAGGPDPWTQDHVEIATLLQASGPADVAFLGPGTDALADLLRTEDRLLIHADAGYAEFGNVEASPPTVVDGVPYPLGRVLYGVRGRAAQDEEVERFIDRFRRGPQAPLAIDTGWLCVGHVDELVSFLPDPMASHGFVAVVADPELGLAVLDRTAPDHPLTRYAASVEDASWAPRETAGQIHDSRWLHVYNHAIAVGPILTLKRTLARELGLRQDEIVSLPVLFEPDPVDPLCGAAALTPNPVNLLLVDHDDGSWAALVPDPWFRGARMPTAADPFVEEILHRIDGRVRVRFVDTWLGYHLLGGEVHCASAIRRRGPIRPP